MEIDISDVKEIDSVSLEKETCRKFDQLHSLQGILKWLKPRLREKTKDFDRYKRFHENIVKIIKHKLNDEAIGDSDKNDELSYELVGVNKIIINGEELLISDFDHESKGGGEEDKAISEVKDNFELVLINGEKVVKIDDNAFIPLSFYNKLYTHQKRALSWLVKLHNDNLGGILADDMGLGKTISLLSLINTLLYTSYITRNGFHKLIKYNQTSTMSSKLGYHSPTQSPGVKELGGGDEMELENDQDSTESERILIVCNVTLIEQWKSEISKWVFNNAKFYILHSNYVNDCYVVNNEMIYIGEGNENFVIYLIGYEYLRINIEYINNYKWHYLILDEGQKIRNPNSLITLAVKTIQTAHRIILSGSPIQNNLVELWSLIDFIIPNYLGSLASFIEDFVVPISSNNENERYVNKLKLLVLPYIFRTVKSKGKNNLLNSLTTNFNTDTTTQPNNTVHHTQLGESSELGNGGDSVDSVDDGDKVESSELGDRGDKLKDGVDKVDSVEKLDKVDLPDKVERIILCNLTVDQYKLYVGVLNKFKYISGNKLNSGYRLSKNVRNVMGKEITRDKNILKLICILRKICNHPKLLLTSYSNYFYTDDTITQTAKAEADRIYSIRDSEKAGVGSSSKLNVSLRIIELWKNEGKKILLFTQTVSMLNIIHEHLIERYGSEKILTLSGKVSVANRNKIIERFTNDEQVFIMLLTTKVGGIGLNLTVATRIIIYDPDWNPMTDSQAKERCYRIGQKSNVIIYRLITANTIEEKIYQRQLYKYYLSQQILNHNILFYNKYINNIQYLLTYPKPPLHLAKTTSQDNLVNQVNTTEPVNTVNNTVKDTVEDEIYKLINDNKNINTFINYNDITNVDNCYTLTKFTSPVKYKPIHLDDQIKRNKLLYNLKSKNTKNINHIITNQILNYFNNNEKITTNNVSLNPPINIQLINHFKPIIPGTFTSLIFSDNQTKLFKSILRNLCIYIKQENYWKLKT